ncbi:MAG: glycosyltransferase family 2 protein [Deltaproteobacteria bacterium]|nr:glycosyltransferase family 2 protein [Deltaproteobacteria bacterium]
MNEIQDSAIYRVAVLIPCFNEEKAIGKVVGDFRKVLPDTVIYVYNNRSTDRTVEIATTSGAIVRDETHPGKGNVVRRMFADIEADIYVLVDGDDTYHAPSASAMVQKLIEERLDMVVGTRLSDYSENAFRLGHRFGNDLLTGFLGMLFGRNCTDILSGYRVFSRRFVKSFPAVSKGFETESELTVHALELRMPIGEMTTPYQTRPENSVSKLRTYRDGIRILLMILVMFKEKRPLTFFSLVFGFLSMISLALAYPVLITYLQTGLVPRFPTAILSTGIMILAFLSLTCGFILDTVTRGRRELKRLIYLSIPAVGGIGSLVNKKK